MMNTCKTCAHWIKPKDNDSYKEREMCGPIDRDTFVSMSRGFEVRICRQPTQTFCEAPLEKNGFGLADASTYLAVFATAEDFGCVRHEALAMARREAKTRVSGLSERRFVIDGIHYLRFPP